MWASISACISISSPCSSGKYGGHRLELGPASYNRQTSGQQLGGLAYLQGTQLHLNVLRHFVLACSGAHRKAGAEAGLPGEDTGGTTFKPSPLTGPPACDELLISGLGIPDKQSKAGVSSGGEG